VEELETPLTYTEAMQGDLSDLWRRAIVDEISSLTVMRLGVSITPMFTLMIF
jgi:hypothetical protein